MTLLSIWYPEEENCMNIGKWLSSKQILLDNIT